jgi:hypothetical protein
MGTGKRCPCGTAWDAVWTDHSYFSHECRHHGSSCEQCKHEAELIVEIEQWLSEAPTEG